MIVRIASALAERESQSRQPDSLRVRHCDLDLRQQRRRYHGGTISASRAQNGGHPNWALRVGRLTWAVDDSISQAELQSINAAFAEWSEVANIQFQQVASTAQSDIDFANSALDGAGNVLGVTGFSFSGGQLESADMPIRIVRDNLSGTEFSLGRDPRDRTCDWTGSLQRRSRGDELEPPTSSSPVLAQSDIDGVRWRFTAPAPPTLADAVYGDHAAGHRHIR